MLICMLSIKMYSYFQPFESASDNFMQEVAQYQLFLVLFTALLIQATAAEDGGGSSTGALLIVVSFIGPVVAIAAQYWSDEQSDPDEADEADEAKDEANEDEFVSGPVSSGEESTVISRTRFEFVYTRTVLTTPDPSLSHTRRWRWSRQSQHSASKETRTRVQSKWRRQIILSSRSRTSFSANWTKRPRQLPCEHDRGCDG